MSGPNTYDRLTLGGVELLPKWDTVAEWQAALRKHYPEGTVAVSLNSFADSMNLAAAETERLAKHIAIPEGYSFGPSITLSSLIRHPPRGQRRRERRRARAQQRRERLREIQLSQRRPGRVDGPRGRITGPGTYDLGGGVTVTFGEGTLVSPG